MWCLWGGALLILCLWNAPGVKNTPMSHGWLSLLAQPRRCSSILLFLSIGRESLRWSLTTPVGVASPRGTSGTAVSVKVTINKEEEEKNKTKHEFVVSLDQTVSHWDGWKKKGTNLNSDFCFLGSIYDGTELYLFFVVSCFKSDLVPVDHKRLIKAILKKILVLNLRPKKKKNQFVEKDNLEFQWLWLCSE